MKKIFIIIIIGILFGFDNLQSQTQNFYDDYGNKFIINDVATIPNRINYDFLKDNLTGAYFIEDIEKTEIRYTFNILEIHSINKNNFRLGMIIIPQTDNVEEILKHMGYSNYKLKKRNNKREISIEFLYGEI